MSDLSVCAHQAKEAAKRAAAWAEATDQFLHDAPVAARFAAEAKRAAEYAQTAARRASMLASAGPGEASAAARAGEYAETAVAAAAHAGASAASARPFTPATGIRSALERARQAAYYAWVACPDPDGSPRLAVLRARVEEAEAALQVAQPTQALAS